jgi:hypothetical protein
MPYPVLYYSSIRQIKTIGENMSETWMIDDNSEPASFAKEIIVGNYPLLISKKILFFMTEKGKFRTKTQIANGHMKASTDADILITVNDTAWGELDHRQRQAQIHWALAHIKAEEDEETGDVKLKMLKPPIQDFPEVAAKWGAWQPEIQEYIDACKEDGPQDDQQETI